jgi:mono/diheme cytochrome c family protein
MKFRRACFWLIAVSTAAYCAADERPADHQLVIQFIKSRCIDCHDDATKSGGVQLDERMVGNVDRNVEVWERVVRKLTARQMPPKDEPRPTESEYNAVVGWLESELDRIAAANPNPGRTETFRRLNRTEYQNTIRDLLAVDVDVAALLPADELSHGFDNITVADLSASLLNRYVSAAQKISRIAIGRAPRTLSGDTFRIRPDVTQDVHIAGSPVGTRGGTVVPYNFPQEGEYEIQVRLMRDRNEGIEGLREPDELEVSLDRQRVDLFTIKPGNANGEHAVDANLKSRVRVTAGTHKVAVAFLKKPSSLLETERKPLNVHFNFYRHPRIGPAIYEISIIGPFSASGPGETPSRQRIFVSQPTTSDHEEECAKRIVADLARRAYRRPVDDQDLQAPLELYRVGRAEGSFEAGIESAVASVLVNPQFLFRIELDPPGIEPGKAYRISELELASRLSYFLWSSMPDDELLGLAAAGQLGQPDVLEQQVKRMLADERSQSLVTNFAGQWLYLRNLESVIPDMRLFPDFDDNLRQAMRQETELFFESILREDRSVLDLIKADYTFLNERLAKHYGIPHVYGSQFRRVAVDDASHRGGLLRQASILTVTSYATRTSPVIRGHWVMKNLIGMPPPPPPENVPALKDNTILSTLSVRERLQQHRADPACASCHQLMDPPGFALDNFDAVGRWRATEAGKPIDAAGGMPGGSEFTGVAGLEQALLQRPELFVRTMTEKLLTFALGRGVEYYDAPAVRQIVRNAEEQDYRFSRLIVGIVQSTPFQMRSSK